MSMAKTLEGEKIILNGELCGEHSSNRQETRQQQSVSQSFSQSEVIYSVDVTPFMQRDVKRRCSANDSTKIFTRIVQHSYMNGV